MLLGIHWKQHRNSIRITHGHVYCIITTKVTPDFPMSSIAFRCLHFVILEQVCLMNLNMVHALGRRDSDVSDKCKLCVQVDSQVLEFCDPLKHAIAHRLTELVRLRFSCECHDLAFVDIEFQSVLFTPVAERGDVTLKQLGRCIVSEWHG